MKLVVFDYAMWRTVIFNVDEKVSHNDIKDFLEFNGYDENNSHHMLTDFVILASSIDDYKKLKMGDSNEI